MIIKSNIEAMQAYQSLVKIDASFNKSLAKLSSGLELPRAQYGGGYFAMANDMEHLYKQYQTSVANLQDAKGLQEVAQTAMLEVNDILMDMNAVAMRAGSELLNTDQRQDLQGEFSQLMLDLSNVVETAMFNQISIWNAAGAMKSFSIQVGEGSVYSFSVQAVNNTTHDLVGGAHSVSTVASASDIVLRVVSMTDDLNKALGELGAEIAQADRKIAIFDEMALQEKALESRINELDFAKEMKNFTSLQVVLQASNAMTAQANMKSQMILQLFGG